MLLTNDKASGSLSPWQFRRKHLELEHVVFVLVVALSAAGQNLHLSYRCH